MSADVRYGMTIPLDGVPLAEHREWYRELVDLGYTDVWSAETNGADGFTPLVLAAAWAPELRLGTAIIPAYTRAPALLAQSVASLASAAPGRVQFGIGTSSNVIVERWNGLAFEEPYRRVRDTIVFLREVLGGAKVDADYNGFRVHGFRLAFVPSDEVPILVAALREGMLRLAGGLGDGAIVNWLSPTDALRVSAIVRDAAARHGRSDPEIVARIFVAPTEDRDTVMRLGRFAIASYLNVPVYAEFHRWLGRADQLEPMWHHWSTGDREAALGAIPDSLVDELIVWGSPQECRDRIAEYTRAGITVPVLALLPFGIDPREATRRLAPR